MKRDVLRHVLSLVLALVLVFSLAGGLAASVRADEYKTLPVGAIVTFGTYPQDGPADPLQWIVLECKDGDALLTTRYGIDSVPFHNRNTSVTWEESDVREWLNTTFYDAAFTAADKAIIQNSWPYAEPNPRYDVDPGKDTMDHVYLMSMSELEYYFPEKEDRICEPTKYATDKGAYENARTGGCWYLLRNPGQNSKYVMSTNSDGSIDIDGGKVASEKGCVRPTIWITIP